VSQPDSLPLPSDTSAADAPSLVNEASDVLSKAGIERPRFEAQVLLAHVLGVTRGHVLAGLHRPLSALDVRQYQTLVQKRAERVPLAYLRGYREFYGLDIHVSEATLIPRPETELLVDLALEQLTGAEGGLLIDVCTGSGCVAVACAVRAPHIRVLACDVSVAALEVAAQNRTLHDLHDRMVLVAGDVLGMISSGVADMVTANPAYIPTADITNLQPEVSVYEPRIALDGGPDGLRLQRRVVAEAYRVLRPEGMLAVEVACGQADRVAALMRCAGFGSVELHRDLAGIERVVSGRRAA